MGTSLGFFPCYLQDFSEEREELFNKLREGPLFFFRSNKHARSAPRARRDPHT